MEERSARTAEKRRRSVASGGSRTGLCKGFRQAGSYCYREARRSASRGRLRLRRYLRPPSSSGRRVPFMNRRFALIQAIISLVALAAVIWWASKQEAPDVPERRRLVPVARRRRCCSTRSRRCCAASAGTASCSLTGVQRLAHRLLRAHRRRLHGEQRAARPRRRGAQGRAALGALRREQAHAARVGGRRADPRPARAGRDLRRRGLRRAQLERASHRPAADHGRSRRGAAGGRGDRAVVHAQPPCLRSRAGLAEAARRFSACPARARGGAAAGRHLRAVGVRGGRVPGRCSRGRPRLQRDGCALPRRADQLRRGASRRSGVDRHLRRRRRLRRTPARGQRLDGGDLHAAAALRPLHPDHDRRARDPGHPLRRLVAPALGHPSRVERRRRGRGLHGTPRPRGHGHSRSSPP